MTWLIAVFARWGVPESLRRPLAIGGAIIALIALLWLLKGCYDRSVIREHEAEREAAASGAREQAADERAKDTATNSASEKELHDAIDNAPAGGELSPADHALNCERLRKLGRIPAACRPGSGD